MRRSNDLQTQTAFLRRLPGATRASMRVAFLLGFWIIGALGVSDVAMAADDEDGVCRLGDIQKKYPAAIKRRHPEALKASPQGLLGSFNGKWNIEEIGLRGTRGYDLICHATLTFDYVKGDGSFATLHYPQTLFLVRKASRHGWTVDVYQPPIQHKNVGQTRNAEGLTPADVAHNKRVDDDIRALNAYARKIRAEEAEETRRRKAPCEQAGGNWGYRDGKLACHFQTTRP